MLLKGAILRHSENPTVMLNNLCARAVGLELGMAEFFSGIFLRRVGKSRGNVTLTLAGDR